MHSSFASFAFSVMERIKGVSKIYQKLKIQQFINYYKYRDKIIQMYTRQEFCIKHFQKLVKLLGEKWRSILLTEELYECLNSFQNFKCQVLFRISAAKVNKCIKNYLILDPALHVTLGNFRILDNVESII